MDNGQWKIKKAGSPKSRKTFWDVEGELSMVQWKMKN